MTWCLIWHRDNFTTTTTVDIWFCKCLFNVSNIPETQESTDMDMNIDNSMKNVLFCRVWIMKPHMISSHEYMKMAMTESLKIRHTHHWLVLLSRVVSPISVHFSSLLLVLYAYNHKWTTESHINCLRSVSSRHLVITFPTLYINIRLTVAIIPLCMQ